MNRNRDEIMYFIVGKHGRSVFSSRNEEAIMEILEAYKPIDEVTKITHGVLKREGSSIEQIAVEFKDDRFDYVRAYKEKNNLNSQDGT